MVGFRRELIETVAETVAFFQEQLFGPGAVATLREEIGGSPGEAERLLREHLTVCFDACHMAVEYEEFAPALETLAVVAYRQPVGRAEIEEIRGVGAGGVLRTLQERGIIDVVGRAETLGRPLLYGTTPAFLSHFGFRSLADLPRPDDLPIVLAQAEANAHAG